MTASRAVYLESTCSRFSTQWTAGIEIREPHSKKTDTMLAYIIIHWCADSVNAVILDNINVDDDYAILRVM